MNKFLTFLTLGFLVASASAYPAYMNSVCDLSDPAVVTRNGIPLARLSQPGTIFYTNLTTMMVHDPYQDTFENIATSGICQINGRINTVSGCSNTHLQLIPAGGSCVRFAEWENIVVRHDTVQAPTGSLNDVLGVDREAPVQHVTKLRGYPPAEYLGIAALTIISTMDSDYTYSSMFTFDYKDAAGIQHRVPILKEFITYTGDPRAFYYSDDDLTVVTPSHVAPHWSWLWSREWEPTDPDAPAFVALAWEAYQAWLAGQVPLVVDPVGQALGINNYAYMYCSGGAAKMARKTADRAMWVDSSYSRATYNLIKEGKLDGIDSINWVPGMHVSQDEHSANFNL